MAPVRIYIALFGGPHTSSILARLPLCSPFANENLGEESGNACRTDLQARREGTHQTTRFPFLSLPDRRSTPTVNSCLTSFPPCDWRGQAQRMRQELVSSVPSDLLLFPHQRGCIITVVQSEHPQGLLNYPFRGGLGNNAEICFPKAGEVPPSGGPSASQSLKEPKEMLAAPTPPGPPLTKSMV